MIAEIPQRILDRFERNLQDSEKPKLFTEDMPEHLKAALQILIALSEHQQEILEYESKISKYYLDKLLVGVFESFKNLNLKETHINKLILSKSLEVDLYQTSIPGLFYLEYPKNDEDNGSPAACLITTHPRNGLDQIKELTFWGSGQS